MLERQRVVNLGCSEHGLRWMQRDEPGIVYLGLDQRRLDTPYRNYVQAEATHLPFNDGSIHRIYADYFFNPIGNTVIDAFRENPHELVKSKYPESLHKWFLQDMRGDYDTAKKHLIEIRHILRTEALQEVSRVLAPYGTINIIDKPFNVRWLLDQSLQDTTLLPEKSDVTSEDFTRSKSLSMLIYEHKEKALKVQFRKLPVLQKTA